jgi:hypothetical protein
VEECDHGSDTSVEKIVDELHVMVDACLADGVFAATFGDDPGPGYGEPVRFCSTGLEEFNIFSCSGIRVACSYARLVAGNLAAVDALFAKCVPY